MTDTSKPPKGSMVIYDYALAPLPPGRYRVEVATEIAPTTNVRDGTVRPEDNTYRLDHERYFDVVGPRFSLLPGDIAGVVPPSNASGPFASVLPQVVLRRRTLPWERRVGATLPAPADAASLTRQHPEIPTPWLALLLLQDGEDYEIKADMPLDQVLPAAVMAALDPPAPGVRAKALDIDAALLADLLPSREELQLLCHVRQVDPDDRELSVEGSDGFFAVVVGNRLPLPQAKARAVLVSLEGRTDLLQADPPPLLRAGRYGEIAVQFSDLLPLAAGVRDTAAMVATPPPTLAPELGGPPQLAQPRLDATPAARLARPVEEIRRRPEDAVLHLPLRRRHRLVVLHEWGFSCDGPADFMGLMQTLDVGLIGKTRDGKPKLTDTGHLAVELGTRAGTREQALYRGPLVPFPLTRDADGPYHSADQARRVSPESGVEDLSYASAFEVGRLLAAADARLAQELMRWRRSTYRQSARLSTLGAVEGVLDLQLAATLPEKLGTPVLALAADRMAEAVVLHAPRPGDAYGIGLMAQVPGLQPAAFAAAFGLTDATQARRALLGSETPLATTPFAVPARAAGPASLDGLLADAPALGRLSLHRAAVLDNVRVRLGAEAAPVVVGSPNTIPRGKGGGKSSSQRGSKSGGRGRNGGAR